MDTRVDFGKSGSSSSAGTPADAIGTQQWFYLTDGTASIGPFSPVDLCRKLDADEISGLSWVYKEGWTDWKPIGEIVADLRAFTHISAKAPLWPFRQAPAKWLANIVPPALKPVSAWLGVGKIGCLQKSLIIRIGLGLIIVTGSSLLVWQAKEARVDRIATEELAQAEQSATNRRDVLGVTAARRTAELEAERRAELKRIAEAEAKAAAERDALAKLTTKANAGDRESQIELGARHIGAESLKWYRMAAEQGSSAAQIAVGEFYDGRGGWMGGLPVNKTEAAKWYRKAANQGEPRAQEFLAEAYSQGIGVVRNEIEAYKWTLLGDADDKSWALGWLPPSWCAIAARLAREFIPSGPDVELIAIARAKAASIRRADAAADRIEEARRTAAIAQSDRQYADQELAKGVAMVTFMGRINDGVQDGTLANKAKDPLWRSFRTAEIRKFNPNLANDPAKLSLQLDALIREASR